MSGGEVLRDLILGLSGLAVGFMLYLAWLSFHSWWRDHGAAFELYRALLLFGVSIMVLLITELIWRAPEIPFTWRSLLYAAASLCVVVGAAGMSVTYPQRKEH